MFPRVQVISYATGVHEGDLCAGVPRRDELGVGDADLHHLRMRDGSGRTAGRLRWRQGDGPGVPVRRGTKRLASALAAIDGQHLPACTRRSMVPASGRADEHLRHVEQADHDHTEGQPRHQYDYENDVNS